MKLNNTYLIGVDATSEGKPRVFYLHNIKTQKTLWAKGFPYLFKHILKLCYQSSFYQRPVFLFNELDYCWAFIVPYFMKNFKHAAVNLHQFKKIEEQYFASAKSIHEKKFVVLESDNKVINVRLLINNLKIEFSCQKRLTGFIVDYSEDVDTRLKNQLEDIDDTKKVFDMLNYELTKKQHKLFYNIGNNTIVLLEKTPSEIVETVTKKLAYGKIIKRKQKTTKNLFLVDITIMPTFKYQIQCYDLKLKKRAILKAKTQKHKVKKVWVLEKIKDFLVRSKDIDVVVLKHAYYKYMLAEKYFNFKNISFSSNSLKAFQKFFGFENYRKFIGSRTKPLLTKEEFNIVNRASTGGFLSYNPDLTKWKGKGFAYDVNGSYASIMIKALPFGKPLKKPPKTQYVTMVEVVIKSFSLKKEYQGKVFPIFPARKTALRVSHDWRPTKNIYLAQYSFDGRAFVASFWLEEWENYVLKYYNVNFEKKKTKKLYWKTKPFANDFVSVLNKIREKVVGNQSLKVKLLTNGFFGMLFRKPYYTTNVFLDLTKPSKKIVMLRKLLLTECFKSASGKPIYSLAPDKYEELKKIVTDGVLKEDYDWIRPVNTNKTLIQFKVYKPIKSSEYGHRHIGSYIAWKARKKLFNAIEEIGYDNIIYFDTDSLYCKDNFDKQLKLNPKAIGFWKKQAEFNQIDVLAHKVFRYNRDKFYFQGKLIPCPNYLKWKYIVAGLPDADDVFKRIGHNKFKAGAKIENVNRIKINIETGKIIKDTTLQLPGGNQNGIT